MPGPCSLVLLLRKSPPATAGSACGRERLPPLRRALAVRAGGHRVVSSRLCVKAAWSARPGCALEGDAAPRDEKADAGRGALAPARWPVAFASQRVGQAVPVRW